MVCVIVVRMPDQTTGPPASGPLPGGPAAPDRSTTENPDRIAALCTYAVGLCAAIVSFSGWSGLAEMAGFNQHATLDLFGWTVTARMSWLFPFLVDAYAIGGTRVWLLGRSITEETRTYARRSALGATALTIVALAGYHGLAVSGPPTGYWYVALAVAVGGIAPAMLGLALHLRSMCSKDAETAPDQPTRPDRPAIPELPTKPTKPARSKPGPVRELPTDHADLNRIIETHPDRVPSKRAIRSLLGCGAEKSKRLHQLLTERTEVTA